jgi:ketosteroid isomerase-like protein
VELEEVVTRANAAFYTAFESLDLKRMEDIWLREPYITCAHPGWPVLVGWGPVMASWERIFGHTFEMSIQPTNVRVRMASEMAWVVLTEQVQSRHYEGISNGTVFATNLFERRGTEWYIVHHHGSPAHPDVDEPADSLQ